MSLEPIDSYTTSAEDAVELEQIAALCKTSNYTTLIALMHWLTDHFDELYQEATE